MNTWQILAFVLLAQTASAALAERVYRWVDEDGVVHYGDKLPPEHQTDTSVLNERGIQVGKIDGPKTPEELAAEARQREEEARRAEQARRDKVLLNTYTTVEEIEMLRDRRLELLDARARVTEQYLENLRARLARLEKHSARFQGADGDSGAALPEKLAEDMLQTMTAIDDYEDRLARARDERAQLYAEFDGQIARYKDLKGLDDAEQTARNP